MLKITVGLIAAALLFACGGSEESNNDDDSSPKANPRVVYYTISDA